jgi:hypothetical protein
MTEGYMFSDDSTGWHCHFIDTTLCDKVCQWLATGQWFSSGTLVSSTNKTDHHNITNIVESGVVDIFKHTAKKIRKLNKQIKFYLKCMVLP